VIFNHENFVQASCPVCHYTLANPFFDGGKQPLATLGWPNSACLAQSMQQYSLDYVQCPRCTHIWNRSFRYESIPYTNNPNRMFNKGMNWQGHLVKTKNLLLSQLPKANPTIIDIGCGEGHFVRSLSESLGAQGRFMGFDPNATSESGVGVEFYPRFFDPLIDILEFSPDLIIMRHVLEHLLDPAAFIDQLAWGAARINKPVRMFAEMPCVDRVLQSKRLVDFFYEHPSQFTTQSFTTLMEQGGQILHLAHSYDDEVIYALIEFKVPMQYQQAAKESEDFYKQAFISKSQIKAQLKALIDESKKVAIWGGTGKAAAFIHYFEANAKDFPLVVDSDSNKVGSFVPKTGQQIQYRDALKDQKVDILIIPSQWRARDILAEMEKEDIVVDLVLIEHEGNLINFSNKKHPYI
jgi:C-methyltransferase C-terminal domain